MTRFFLGAFLGALEEFCMQQKLMSMTLTSSIHWLAMAQVLQWQNQVLQLSEMLALEGCQNTSTSSGICGCFGPTSQGPEIPAVASGINSRKFIFRKNNGDRE